MQRESRRGFGGGSVLCIALTCCNAPTEPTATSGSHDASTDEDESGTGSHTTEELDPCASAGATLAWQLRLQDPAKDPAYEIYPRNAALSRDASTLYVSAAAADYSHAEYDQVSQIYAVISLLCGLTRTSSIVRHRFPIRAATWPAKLPCSTKRNSCGRSMNSTGKAVRMVG